MDGPALNVIVPLGGVGSRFQKEGFLNRPKPFVRVHGKEMILWVLDNLKLRADDALTLIFNPKWMSMSEYMREIVAEKYPAVNLVELPGPTRGAAETVLIGLRNQPPDIRRRPTLLADGDTFYSTADVVGLFRAQAARGIGALMVFHDTQPKPIYSYSQVDSPQSMLITEIREKVKISDYANSGIYCFPNGDQLAEQCAGMIAERGMQLSQDGVGEFYTSGVVAAMIRQRLADFRAIVIPAESFHVVGTPAQVADYARTHQSQQRRVAFALEGVLVSADSQPIHRNIRAVRELKAQGGFVIVHTVRRESREVTALLRDLRIPCDELVLCRPDADMYVEAKCVDSILGDIQQQLGFYSGGSDTGTVAVTAPAVVTSGSGGAVSRVPLSVTIAALFFLFVLVLTGFATPGFLAGAVLGTVGTALLPRLFAA
eukprot:TRINITY_DN15435_c0_g1_i1.p1 TRINITY_DN15435_c0_g1~~TRINITY_DN15435_c0_g1_i1.p1  ORF type:complete len:429 (+),score=148.09 TRINITY_DN15435_c0_g1_i1:67-1353(+)